MDWETLYSDASRLRLPEATDNRAQIDFLLSLTGKHPEFAGYWRQEISGRAAINESAPSLEDLVSKFRMQRNEKLAVQGKDSQSATARHCKARKSNQKGNQMKRKIPPKS
jgi:hypothetical protein